MPPWLPVVVTILLGCIGLAIQAAVLAYFLGRMKQHQESQATLVATLQNFTAKAIDALTNRLGAVDSFTAESKADRSALSARLTALERNTDGLQKLKEDFAGFMGGARAHQERVESDISRLNNGVEGMQRQIGQLAIHGPGQLVELPGTSARK